MLKPVALAILLNIAPTLALATDQSPAKLLAQGVVQGALDCGKSYPHFLASLEKDFLAYILVNTQYLSLEEWKAMEQTLNRRYDAKSEEYCRTYFAQQPKFDDVVSTFDRWTRNEEQIKRIIKEQRDERNAVGLELDDWAVVKSVVPNSPAAKSGIQVEDRIKLINGRSVQLVTDFMVVLLESAPASKVRISVMRDNMRMVDFDVELTSVKEMNARAR